MIPRPFETHVEQAYGRDVLFAVELLDAVTLERIGRDIVVTAEGLQGKPIVNKSGFFVWLREDFTRLEKLTIDPGRLPYEFAELAKTDVQQPLTTIELSPRPDYSFPSGMTGLLGTLVEEQSSQPRVPIAGAEVHLQWLDDLGNVQNAPTKSHTNDSGDFAAFLRFAPNETPQLDAKGALTVRLRVHRGSDERGSADLKLPAGRIAEPSTFPQGKDLLIFAWDELQP
ncbi:MAG: hypothetical protein ACM3JB_20595 [Acidobacteriaceae bacterium]